MYVGHTHSTTRLWSSLIVISRRIKPEKGRWSHWVCLALITGLSVGCTTTGGSLAEENDPFENFNRSMTSFNDQVDRFAIDPVYRAYVKLPQPVRNRFGSFVRNLDEPNNAVNGLLQGKVKQAVDDTLRFIINSTIGLLGLFDVARHFGLPRHDEDFGQTLATWGVGPGPYLVLPLLGPNNTRGAIGRIPYTLYLDPTNEFDDSLAETGVTVLRLMNVKERLAGTRRVLDLQLDPYIFTRESFRQRREQMIAE